MRAGLRPAVRLLVRVERVVVRRYRRCPYYLPVVLVDSRCVAASLLLAALLAAASLAAASLVAAWMAASLSGVAPALVILDRCCSVHGFDHFVVTPQ